LELNLSEFEHWGRERAIAAYEAGDAEAFVCSAPSNATLHVVFDNARQLKRRGIYESALIHGYVGTKTNFGNWTTPVLQFMFDFADRAKLLSAGEPLPDGDKFTVYRGVAGKGCKRRVRGFSWTLDYEKAEWFANRFNYFGDPAVFQATIDRADVLAYTNQRNEQEIICRPRSAKRIKSLALAVA